MSNEHNHFPVVSEGQIGGGSVQTVNGRDLHAFLGLSRDFNQWMREQIERARLVDGRDFQSYEDVGLGPRARKEYALALDAAKHIAMMSGTDKGFDVREYFIECERRVKDALDPIKVLNDPEAMRGILLSYTEKVLALEAKIEAATPKVEFYDAYLNADGLYGLQNAARALNCRPNLFIRWLKENYLFYQGGNLVARIQQIQMGNFEVKTTLVDDKVRPQAFVTPKGLKYLDARVPDHIRVSGRAA